MRVRDWMTVSVTTVQPRTTARGAAQLMATTGVRHLVVVHGGRVVGMLSNRDVLPSVVAEADHRSVQDVMSSGPHTIAADEPLDAAVRLLLSRHISALPVVDDDGALQGIITTTDLLLALQPEPAPPTPRPRPRP